MLGVEVDKLDRVAQYRMKMARKIQKSRETERAKRPQGSEPVPKEVITGPNNINSAQRPIEHAIGSETARGSDPNIGASFDKNFD